MLRTVLTLIIILASLPALASDPMADTEAIALSQRMETFRHDIGLARIRRFEESGPSMGLSRTDRKRKTEYFELKKNLQFWQEAADLKAALENRYTALHLQIPSDLKEETNLIAITLIRRIQELRAQYNIDTFPLVHNLMIDTGLKKRGACKHWAEDLLSALHALPLKHFRTQWGEAHAGKIREHNVAVLVPQETAFQEGLIIDPWRTAGRPFWIPVKDDHYPWQLWTGYEPGKDVL